LNKSNTGQKELDSLLASQRPTPSDEQEVSIWDNQPNSIIASSLPGQYFTIIMVFFD
jgi:hypothetical protein